MIAPKNAMHNPTVLSVSVVLVFVLSIQGQEVMLLLTHLCSLLEPSPLLYSPLISSQPIVSHHQEVLHQVVHTNQVLLH